MVRTPDGHSKLELTRYLPSDSGRTLIGEDEALKIRHERDRGQAQFAGECI
jgi:hypothetical protein